MFTTFIPPGTGTASRNILTGYLAVDADAGSDNGVKAEGYGALRMLVVSADTTVPGPGQVQNTFDADPVVSSQINLLRQGQSEVLNGNLLTLPVGGGLLVRAARLRAVVRRHPVADAAEGARCLR